MHIPATWSRVTGTQRRTTLGHAPHQVSLVEHVLAALSGLRIDNCWIELDAPEPPGLDGSSAPVVAALRDAGVEMQPAERSIWTVRAPVTVRQDGATLTFHPVEAEELRVSYLLDYGADSPIGRQKHTLAVTPASFAADLAACRTFVLWHEAEEFQRSGIGQHITPADILVFGPRGPVANQLKHADEPARHKILDIVGDLALLGHDLRGHVVGYRSGHPLNVELVRMLADAIPERTTVPFRIAA